MKHVPSQIPSAALLLDGACCFLRRQRALKRERLTTMVGCESVGESQRNTVPPILGIQTSYLGIQNSYCA